MISISKDKTFLLIKEMKEYIKILSDNTIKSLMKRHKLKMQIKLLEQILHDEGIDTMLQVIKNEKNSMIVRDEIVKEEKETTN